jgi:subtilisin-like proprotein convertase family protein
LTRGSIIALVVALVVSSGLTPLLGGDDAVARKKKRTAAANGVIVEEFQNFTNNTPIAITDNTQSTASSITVSGFDTPVADVEVSLNVVTHPQPADLDILLVGPSGQTALIMSNCCGAGAAANDNPTFDDQAANQLPNTGDLVSGTFQPTNYDFAGGPDTFLAPAPTNPGSGSALAVFNGTNANGPWTLFVRDEDNDTPDTNGSIGGGWSLRITSANGVPRALGESFQVTAGRTLDVPAAGVLGNDSDPDGDSLEAVLAGAPRRGSVSLNPDGSFSYRANRKARGSDSFTYLARDPGGLTALADVEIQIKGKKKKRRR